jgi:protocatechuate 3,4-dioxygenase, alpha subunit
MTTHLLTTGSQTVGPFFKYAINWRADGKLFDDASVHVSGTLFDAQGQPVTDGFLELWQPRAGQQGAQGFARAHTDAQGRFVFTCAPAAQSTVPYVNVAVFARGLLAQFNTRVYLTSAQDDVLSAAGIRAASLQARSVGTQHWQWDVHLGGAHETVFLNL